MYVPVRASPTRQPELGIFSPFTDVTLGKLNELEKTTKDTRR